MNWLYESPVTIVLLGIAVMLALGVAWASSGRRELVWAILAWVGVVAAMLGIEHFVVTDREQIPITLKQIIQDVKSNDRQKLTRHIYSGAPTLKQKADTELPNYQFTMLRITHIHSVNVDEKAAPKSAIIEFNISAAGKFSASGLGELTIADDQQVLRYIKLNLRQEADGTWKVEDYSHADPTAFMYERNPSGSSP